MKKRTYITIGCLAVGLAVVCVVCVVVSPMIAENHRRHSAHDIAAAMLNQQGELEEVVRRSGFSFTQQVVSRQDTWFVADIHGWQIPDEPDLSFHRLSVPGLRDFAAYIAYEPDDRRVVWVEIQDDRMPSARITPNKSQQ